MKSDVDSVVRSLLDRAAIQDLLLRYARGVDRRDLDLVASCFTEDAAYEGSLARGDLAAALVALREAMPRYERTMHFIGNQLIELRGDAATSETYAIAHHLRARREEPRLYVVGVRYVDDLVRRGTGWRIRRRVVHLDWRRDEPTAA